MAKTPSTMVPLGTPAPAFALPDVRTGTSVSLSDFESQASLLVMFICRHCPFVVHVQGELAALGRDYEGQSLGLVAISSNDVTSHPEDAPERLAAQAREQGFAFPYLFDESQAVARAYGAACTPDFFLFERGPDGFRLAYRGQLDDSRPGNGKPVTGRDLRQALDAVLAGKPVPGPQQPSIGCNIKFRST
jgi:peroxiredoxin